MHGTVLVVQAGSEEESEKSESSSTQYVSRPPISVPMLYLYGSQGAAKGRYSRQKSEDEERGREAKSPEKRRAGSHDAVSFNLYRINKEIRKEIPVGTRPGLASEKVSYMLYSDFHQSVCPRSTNGEQTSRRRRICAEKRTTNVDPLPSCRKKKYLRDMFITAESKEPQ